MIGTIVRIFIIVQDMIIIIAYIEFIEEELLDSLFSLNFYAHIHILYIYTHDTHK